MSEIVTPPDVARGAASTPANMPSPQPPRPTESSHARALTALRSELPQPLSLAGEYLDALLAVLPSFALQEPANGLLDVKVLEAVDSSAPYLAEYRDFVAAATAHPDSDSLLERVGDFLTSALAHKRAAGACNTQCHLWRDGFRFILREWFLTTLAILVRAQQYDAARALLTRRYRLPADEQAGQDEAESFVAFDSYVKTLDEFRARRLGLHRVSLSADLLHQRLDEALTPLEDIMQCDFVLCLHSLLHNDDPLQRWYPRTLVFGDACSQQGFDLFVTGTDPARFGPVAALLQVADRAELVARFDALESDFNLSAWAFGGVTLDFRGFLGLRKAALCT